MNKIKKYEIYDAENSNWYEDYPVVVADSGREAIDKYLKDTEIEVVAFGYESDDNPNTIRFKTTPFYEKDGRKYKYGRITWWVEKISTG